MPQAPTLTLSEEVSFFLEDIAGPDGARELSKLLLSERDKLAYNVKEMDVVYSDPNDPKSAKFGIARPVY